MIMKYKKTSNGIKYYINDWGCVCTPVKMRTVKRYRELKDERSKVDCYQYKCFYAFSEKQVEEGKKKAKIAADEKVYSAGDFGLCGTSDGIDAYIAALAAYRPKIKAECDPQEVYFEEYNNHECGYAGDDKEAFGIVKDIYGEDIAKKITRVGYGDLSGFGV